MDIDDFDPLDDILLSDDEFFGPAKHKPLKVTEKETTKKESSLKEETESRKKRMLEELFGTKEDEKPVSIIESDLENQKPKEITESKNEGRHSWLGLDEEIKLDEKLTVEPIPLSRDVAKRSQSTSFDTNNTSSNEKDKDEKTKSINENEQSERPITAPLKKSNEVNRSEYLLSTGFPRRRGLSKSRDFLSNIATIDYGSTNKSLTKTSGLPSWLGRKSQISEEEPANMPNKDTSKLDEGETKMEMKMIDNEEKKEVLLPIGNNEQLTNESSLIELHKKQMVLKENTKAQIEILENHEKTMRNAVYKLIQQQHNDLNNLLQVMTDSDQVINKGGMKEKLQKCMEENHDLQIQIKQLELEKINLEMMGKHVESRYEMEITSLEENYKYNLEVSLERERKLKEEIELLKMEMKDKSSRQKEEFDEYLKLNKDTFKQIIDQQMSHFTQIQCTPTDTRYLTPTREMSHEEFKKLDAEISAKEEMLQEKEIKLKNLEMNINGRTAVLESKEASLERRVREFEIKCRKENEKLQIRNKEIKRNEEILNEEREMFEKEQQTQLHHINQQKRQMKDLEEKLLKKEHKMMEMKFELAMEKSRLEAIINFEGLTDGSITNMIKAKAEVVGKMKEIENQTNKIEENRRELQRQQNRINEQGWKLKNLEDDLVLRAKHIESLLKQSENKREEGVKAMKKAERIEKEVNDKMEEISDKLVYLTKKEKQLMQEKLDISAERNILNKKRLHLEAILPMVSTLRDGFIFDHKTKFTDKDIVDPNFLIMRLKAEKNEPLLKEVS